MIVQGTVQRMVYGEGLPHVEHRTRDLSALFSEAEWGWSSSGSDAYVFAFFERSVVEASAYEQSAESHAAALMAAGEKHVMTCVYGSEAKAARAKARADRDASAEQSVREITPEESFARLERRGLA